MQRTRAASISNTSSVLSQECKLFIRDFKRQALQIEQRNKRNGEMMIKDLISQIDIAISRHSPAILSMTLGELWKLELQGHEVTSTVGNLKTIKIPRKMIDQTHTQQSNPSYESYKTESRPGGENVSSTIVFSPRRTRSRTRGNISYLNSMHGLVESSTQKKTSISKMDSSKKYLSKTPYSKTLQTQYAAVTPKIQPNSSIHVLRRPKIGEMVLSMQGSPLLVSGIVQERVANINVPTSNGNLISLLPNHGLRLSSLPPIDRGTISQLKTLNSHIEKIIKSQ